jgi:hypothetical protein
VAHPGGENGVGVDTPFSALLSSLRAPTPKGAALLSDFGAITPTVVYTGATRTPDQLAKLNVEEAAPHHKKKAGGKTLAAKPPGADEKATSEKATGAKAPEEKGTEAKAKDGKTKPAVHWTPNSSSPLAASTPPAADKPKKKPHKAAAAAKPATAPAQ